MELKALTKINSDISNLENKSLDKVKILLNSDLQSSVKLQMIRQATSQHKLETIICLAQSVRQ